MEYSGTHHAEDSEIFRGMAPMMAVDQTPPQFDLSLELDREHERQRERAHEHMASEVERQMDSSLMQGSLSAIPEDAEKALPRTALAAEPQMLSTHRTSNPRPPQMQVHAVTCGTPVLHNECVYATPFAATVVPDTSNDHSLGIPPLQVDISSNDIKSARRMSVTSFDSPTAYSTISSTSISPTLVSPAMMRETVESTIDLQAMPSKQELQEELKQVNEIQRVMPVPHINVLADMPLPVKVDFTNLDGSVRWLDFIRAKVQRVLHTMAMDKVDGIEDQKFKMSKVKSSVDRLFENTKYIQEVGKTICSISRWDNPAVSSMSMMLYFFLLFEELVLPTVVGVIVCVITYFGLKRPSTAKSLGLSCLLYDAASSEPRFSTQSQKNKQSGSLSAGAAHSPLRPTQLMKFGIEDIWPELRNDSLGWIQLELRDMADIIEKAKSLIYWRKPGATFAILVGLAIAFPVTWVLPARFLAKPIGLLFGLEFFLLIPLQNRFPRYRRLFSLAHLSLWPFPTDAEWAIEQYTLRESLTNRGINEMNLASVVDHGIITPKNKELISSQSVDNITLLPDNTLCRPNSSNSLDNNHSSNTTLNNTAISSATDVYSLTTPRERTFSTVSYNTGVTNAFPTGGSDVGKLDAATLLAEEPSVKEFTCTFDNTVGKLYLTSSTLLFRPGPLFNREKHEVIVPYSRIVKLKKASPRHYLIMRNKRLEITLSSGETLVFSNMRDRDNAFNSLAAYSSDGNLRWRIPGT